MEPQIPAADVEAPAGAPPPIAKPRQRFPVVTLLACAACILVFIGLSLEDDTKNWATLSKWGFFPANRIREGAYWGLITSAFVHLEIWHVAFNVYWLYLLGIRLEREIGSLPWLVLILSSALVSSAAEVTFAGTTGIGASGVVYALFGFMWITRRRFPGFQSALDQRTIILFFAWLVGCLFLTLSHVWNVGNAAHFAGLLFGAGCGAWLIYQPHRRLIAAAVSVVAVFSFVGLFWAPWSGEWASWRGYRAYLKGDFKSAIHWYHKGLELGEDKVWSWQNLAYAYYSLDDADHYRSALEMVRHLDENVAKQIESEIANGKRK